MKKIYFLLVLTLVSSSFFGQIIAFPDAAFKNALVATMCATPAVGSGLLMDVDSNNDGEIDVSEAEAIGSLNISNQSISSVEGLSYFRNLYGFYCDNNQLTTIDVSSLTGLNYFTCPGNLFTTLSLCGTAVGWFDCSGNPNLTSISVKNNVISGVLGGRTPSAEPPIGMLNFNNCPQLATVCYDEGEYNAVHYTLGFAPNVALITDCVLDCTSLAVADRNVGAAFQLAPNPVVDFLTVESNFGIQSITIYNVLGQQLHAFTNASFDKKMNLDVSALPNGTYLVGLMSTSGKSTQKLIKL